MQQIRTVALAASAALGFLATVTTAQAPTRASDPPPLESALKGAIDVHAHMGPDSPEPGERSIDVIDFAKMAKARGMRAFIEVNVSRFFREPGGEKARQPAIDAIRKLAPEHIVISSDLGQVGSPSHPDGLSMGAARLRSQGVTDQELARMMKENPARVLGLPPP